MKDVPLILVSKAYVDTVNILLDRSSEAKKELYIESNNGEYINFLPINFRKALKVVLINMEGSVDKVGIDKYLNAFKDLFYITADSKDRFTNTQKIHGKTKRVITVKADIYKRVRSLLDSNCSDW